ncbi:hypothetical protein BO70DRAFT_362896 [Aspergillus heteromorphus CBS 117.55]|uniref:Uncharacterized protein n=1 Tax=Aspergillus heteromorphus CBS 117.55 TaxID=1448321 RepID=A0A317VZP1_9EURO|nr:uncharacterized protein BO70DRAFT_362896 [Aspergillus heteromorphus CBS 117.55]PWY79119.1 hypothetical protein BO70DRAFT_362896 [Aspergillus heteromorphus CBS 117.55]
MALKHATKTVSEPPNPKKRGRPAKGAASAAAKTTTTRKRAADTPVEPNTSKKRARTSTTAGVSPNTTQPQVNTRKRAAEAALEKEEEEEEARPIKRARAGATAQAKKKEAGAVKGRTRPLAGMKTLPPDSASDTSEGEVRMTAPSHEGKLEWRQKKEQAIVPPRQETPPPTSTPTPSPTPLKSILKKEEPVPEEPPLYTDEFFADIAASIARSFPLVEFAAAHKCSINQVAQAIGATIIAPLTDTSFCWHEDPDITIATFGQHMMDTWAEHCKRTLALQRAAEKEESGDTPAVPPPADSDSDSSASSSSAPPSPPAAPLPSSGPGKPKKQVRFDLP